MELNERYTLLLERLLPRGPAWSNDDRLLAGLAPALARVHQRGDELMAEIDPRSTTELINRYEAITGLPDSCAPPGVVSLAQRRQRLDAKINLAGGINEAFYLAQLAALGYPDASITRFYKSPFRCTSRCNESLYNVVWRYYWQVNMPQTTKTFSMTCASDCRASLRTWGDTVVECVMQKLCPSHTYVIFVYPE